MATLMTIPDVELVLRALRRLEGSREIPSRPADIAIEGIAQREEYRDE
jgi:hypothetical protein